MQHHVSAISNPQKNCHNCLTRKYCLAKNLSGEELERSQHLMGRHRLLKKGQRLFMQGEKLESLFIVKSGSAKSYYLADDGEQQITGFHFPGQLLGINGLEESTHTVCVEALETTSVCELDHNCFDHLCETVPAFRFEFYRAIGRELGQDKRHMLVLGKLHADQRLADFILKIAAAKKGRGQAYREFIFSMTRSDIANYLGVAVETISRLFSRFQFDGLINVKNRIIEIVDLEKLQAVAGNIAPSQVFARSA